MSSSTPDVPGDGVTRPRVRVAVVFGGRSTEHAISCISAGSVLGALDREAFDVVPLGITRQGRWVLAPDEPDRLAITDGALPAVGDGGATVALAGDPTNQQLVVQAPGRVPEVLAAVDVVFPLLHGPYGEDGTIQGLLELAGIPYVGSGVLASAAAMDKAVAKTLLAAAGLVQSPYVVITDREWTVDEPAALVRVHDQLRLPVFVKPARAGSSVGISKVTSWGELPTAVEQARLHDPKVVVEQGVEGREIECGVLEREDGLGPEASVCAEITVRGDHEFYDFEAKYLDDVTDLQVPADLDPEVAERVRACACLAYDALGCEDYARVDFFVTAEGNVVVNEVNTIPGFTPISMFPRMWAETGIPYSSLVERLVRSALRKRLGLR
ncbi:MAG TPA: D-alanine--D-alanine ligase family protein [Actinomycetes bacterium]|nr:D-alanine--D-alanine ligase family protein [Actinomycetes bacterium]